MPGAPSEPVLRAVRMSRSFGDGAQRRFALKDVSVELYPGQLALLMGPSGSGKSTLLAVLSGLLAPDSGQVFAQDRGREVDVWAMSDTEREQFRLRHTGFAVLAQNPKPQARLHQQHRCARLQRALKRPRFSVRRHQQHHLAVRAFGNAPIYPSVPRLTIGRVAPDSRRVPRQRAAIGGQAIPTRCAGGVVWFGARVQANPAQQFAHGLQGVWRRQHCLPRMVVGPAPLGIVKPVRCNRQPPNRSLNRTRQGGRQGCIFKHHHAPFRAG